MCHRGCDSFLSSKAKKDGKRMNFLTVILVTFRASFRARMLRRCAASLKSLGGERKTNDGS